MQTGKVAPDNTLKLRRAFAYPKDGPINEHGLVELVEFSISADPQSIRILAKFMLEAADQMESMGQRFDHVHAQDQVDAWPDHWPDLVICGAVKNEL